MSTSRLLTRSERLRRLRYLYVAEGLSGLGDGVFWVGLVVAIDDSPSFTTLLTAAVVARLGPRALLSLPAGKLVDRSNVRRILITTDLIRAALMITLGIGITGGLGLGWVLPGVLIAYLVGVPWRPALAASLPSIASERDLAHANSVISVTRQIMTFLGPLAGVAVATWSVAAAFVINGLTFALSAACIAAVRGVLWPGNSRRHPQRSRPTATPASVTHAEGLRAIMPLTALMYFVRGAEMVLHVLVIKDLIGAEPSSIGYLGGAIGLGALLITPFARRWAATDAALVPLLGSLALTAIPSAMLAAVGELNVAALLVVPVGAGMVLFEVITVVTVQRATPAEVLGRTFGALNAASNAGKLAGAVVSPLLVSAFGLQESLVIVAGLLAAGGLGCFIPLRRLSERTERRRSYLAPTVRLLGDLDLFRGASQVSLERLAQHLAEEEVEPGRILIEQGDHADDLYVIVNGEFDVIADGVTINQVAAGSWVGEIGLVHDVPRTATVVARTPSTVWRIPGGLFLAVLAGSDDTTSIDGDIARRLSTAQAVAR